MKWFQHLSDSHTSPKIRQILRKYGLEGVGLWWISCELVAKDGADYCIKKEKEWKITLSDVAKIEIKKLEEMLKFFAEINAIDNKALNVGNLRIKQMSEYSDDYTKRSDRVRRVSEHSSDSVRQDNNTLHNNTLHNNTKEESVCLVLRNWNERQSSPIPAFKPENIVKKHGIEKVEGLIKKYGQQNNGYHLFLEALKI